MHLFAYRTNIHFITGFITRHLTDAESTCCLHIEHASSNVSAKPSSDYIQFQFTLRIFTLTSLVSSFLLTTPIYSLCTSHNLLYSPRQEGPGFASFRPCCCSASLFLPMTSKHLRIVPGNKFLVFGIGDSYFLVYPFYVNFFLVLRQSS